MLSKRGLLTRSYLYAGTLTHELVQLERSNTGKTYALVCWLPSWDRAAVPRSMPLTVARAYAEQLVRDWFTQCTSPPVQP